MCRMDGSTREIVPSAGEGGVFIVWMRRKQWRVWWRDSCINSVFSPSFELTVSMERRKNGSSKGEREVRKR